MGTLPSYLSVCTRVHVCPYAHLTYRNVARVIGGQSMKKNLSKHLETFSVFAAFVEGKKT